MYPTDTFLDPVNLLHQVSTAMVQGAISLTMPTRPLDWANADDAQVMRLAHAQLNTGIGAIPALTRLLTGDTADALVFIAVATGSATIEQLAELLESDPITTGERLRREEGRQLDTLDERLAALSPTQADQLQLTASGLPVDNLPEHERTYLFTRLDELSAALRAHVTSGNTETVDQLFTPAWLAPWRPSVLLNLDRQIRHLTLALN